jgi:hypothetical protein
VGHERRPCKTRLSVNFRMLVRDRDLVAVQHNVMAAKNAVILTFIRVHYPMNLCKFFPTHSEQLHIGRPGPGLG